MVTLISLGINNCKEPSCCIVFSAKTNFGQIIRIKSISAVMKGIKRIDEKIFNFTKSCRSIFIDIGDVKNEKFNIKSV